MPLNLPLTGTISGVDDPGYGYVASQVAQRGPCLILTRDHAHMLQIAAEIQFFAPQVPVLTLPAWDVQPYDRLAPDVQLQAGRVQALRTLQQGFCGALVATVNGVGTKLPASAAAQLELQAGQAYPREALVQTLLALGFNRDGSVTEPGEFAVRGGILDIFPPQAAQPVRAEFWDDTLDTLHTFDPITQRRLEAIPRLEVTAAGELQLSPTRIEHFRQQYRQHFPNGVQDALYQHISAGILPDVALHYLPLFFAEALPSVFDLLAQSPTLATVLAPSTFANALVSRQEALQDAYTMRLKLLAQSQSDVKSDLQGGGYRPLPPEMLYLTEQDWQTVQTQFQWLQVADFSGTSVGIVGHQFGKNLSARVTAAVEALQVFRGVAHLCAPNPGLLAQLQTVLNNASAHGLQRVKLVESPLAFGFQTPTDFYITAQDVFGPRHDTAVKRKSRQGQAMLQFTDLQPGDYVVHEAHGIGRFDALVTLEIPGSTQQQDFIKLTYADNDRVFVPVEALDLLSRYSSAEAGAVVLDKLGGVAWQARRAKLKKNLLAMAGDLMRMAAARSTLTKEPLPIPDSMYTDFTAMFPYTPTREQQTAIEETLADMAEPRPMDRLVIGDVGFGKTEVALRAACVAVGNGKQVAVVCPTTLLARQHLDVFSQRFAGFPIRVRALSRLVSSAQAKQTKTELAAGSVDIVIGTHALLSQDVKFKDLGLLVIDEEQRFGVKHKERLKAFRATVDVLTLSATPIPRTLHMAFGGLKQLSQITTPPVDRLAVRSYVLAYDPKVIREAILREVHRGGQVYVVCPRVQDLRQVADKLVELVPEISARVAHGQLPETALDDLMSDFYAGAFQVLIATTIIESGLDVPRANTIIVHRADRFGLSQLHQLRGRVGRSNVRAYAYFLLPEGQMAELATRRLKMLQRLDHLGAGFQLASFDMDLRGAGNLVGEQQSGHITDVGFELYTKLLQEAVAEIKAAQGEDSALPVAFTPSLNLGFTYVLPEDYVPDLATRLQLYRRLAALTATENLDEIRAELQDRFGPLPQATERLLQVVSIRNQCRALNIDKLDVGGKGCVVRFRNNTFAQPTALLHYIQQNSGLVSINRDQTLTLHKAWGDAPEKRIAGVKGVLSALAALGQYACNRT